MEENTRKIPDFAESAEWDCAFERTGSFPQSSKPKIEYRTCPRTCLGTTKKLSRCSEVSVSTLKKSIYSCGLANLVMQKKHAKSNSSENNFWYSWQFFCGSYTSLEAIQNVVGHALTVFWPVVWLKWTYQKRDHRSKEIHRFRATVHLIRDLDSIPK